VGFKEYDYGKHACSYWLGLPLTLMELVEAVLSNDARRLRTPKCCEEVEIHAGGHAFAAYEVQILSPVASPDFKGFDLLPGTINLS